MRVEQGRRPSWELYKESRILAQYLAQSKRQVHVIVQLKKRHAKSALIIQKLSRLQIYFKLNGTTNSDPTKLLRYLAKLQVVLKTEVLSSL